MPTGYTANVPDGISFQQFVWQCARGMGALIMMRDEPSDAPIPERFEPSDYHVKKLAEANQAVARLLSLTPDQVKQKCEESCAKLEALRLERIEENKAQINSYQAMLAEVLAWEPPTDDHKNFKDFMIEQLQSSVKFDDSSDHLSKSHNIDPDQWLSDRLASAKRDIEYHSKAHREEVARTESRNEWIQQLRASLSDR